MIVGCKRIKGLNWKWVWLGSKEFRIEWIELNENIKWNNRDIVKKQYFSLIEFI